MKLVLGMEVGLSPQPRRPCGVRWGPSSFPQKGAEPLTQFLAHFYCDQTAGCTKMPLGIEVGLSQETLYYLGTQPPPQKGAEPQFFDSCLLRPNGCIDQDATWYGCWPQLRDFVLDGDPVFPPNKGGGAPFPIFGPFLLYQMAGCIKMPLGMEVGLSTGEFVLDGDPDPLPKRGRIPLHNVKG